jgi:preprotein translocase subunit SecY
MISAFRNSFKIPELRQRILFTLIMIVVVRIGCAITLPGVDAAVVQDWIIYMQKQVSSSGTAGFAQMLNIFSGGGITQCALFALGIMPYISASIMVQLGTAVVPKLSRLAREDGGRQKINQYTRFITLILCVLQGTFMAKGLIDPSGNPLLPMLGDFLKSTGQSLVLNPSTWWIVQTVLVLTAGTFFLMWLGDQITERGIGNGISIIISVNIVSELPGALVQLWKNYISGSAEDPMKALTLLGLIVLLFAVIAGIIAITQAVRKIVIQYAKRQIGRKVLGGQSTHLPLKVNYSGVMPIIFSQALLMFPAYLISTFAASTTWGATWTNRLSGGHWMYYLIDAVLIFGFSFFWVATMFQPTQIADDLKKNGGYIPGVRPGKPTADFLDFTMSRLTMAGAIFLVAIAIFPTLINYLMKINNPKITQFFGGTSILILVGVILDVMRQVETHLLKRHYDGFLRKGKIRGRFERQSTDGGNAGADLTWLYIVLAVIVLAGVTYALYHQSK